MRPPVQWAQRRDKLMISVYLTDIHNEKFSLDETKLTFRLVLLGGVAQLYTCIVVSEVMVVTMHLSWNCIRRSSHRFVAMETYVYMSL